MKANYEDQTYLNEIKNSTSLEREAQRCFEGIKASRTCVLLIQRSKRLFRNVLNQSGLLTASVVN